MAFSKILDFLRRLKIHSRAHKILEMTEKVKTVVGCYFMLPYFKSRGQPSHSLFYQENVWFVTNNHAIWDSPSPHIPITKNPNTIPSYPTGCFKCRICNKNKHIFMRFKDFMAIM